LPYSNSEAITMNRKESITRIKKASKINGFTILDVIPEFPGIKPTEIEAHLKKAYDLGFISVNAKSPACMYPTNKLINFKIS